MVDKFIGHSHPQINLALKNQLEDIEHVMLAGLTHQPVVELSERLIALTKHHFRTGILWLGWCLEL
jgi:adenosylmethionine-8-amino-7-oxononanoate aminotransferase